MLGTLIQSQQKTHDSSAVSVCSVCTTWSRFNIQMASEWTWRPPHLFLFSKLSRINEERGLPESQACSQTAELICWYQNIKKWRRTDMKFPPRCLLSVMMKFTHCMADVQEAAGGMSQPMCSVAGHVICYHCCGEVDLWLSLCNES